MEEKKTCDTCIYRMYEAWESPCNVCLGDETDYMEYEADLKITRYIEGDILDEYKTVEDCRLVNFGCDDCEDCNHYNECRSKFRDSRDMDKEVSI